MLVIELNEREVEGIGKILEDLPWKTVNPILGLLYTKANAAKIAALPTLAGTLPEGTIT